ncbi:MAG: hypothetical protein ACLFPM_01500 [Candidatus Izemoplasmatales bacterium]
MYTCGLCPSCLFIISCMVNW